MIGNGLNREHIVKEILDDLQELGISYVEINKIVSSLSKEDEVKSLQIAIKNAYDDIVNGMDWRDKNFKPGDNNENELIVAIHERLGDICVLSRYISRGYVLQLISDYLKTV